MAMQADPSLTPQVICNAFVQQYYRVLNRVPEHVHKFYHDRSIVGRAGSDGVMEYVTTYPEISKKLMSRDFSEYSMKIETEDAVLSHNGGLLIVVTGSLTMADRACQRFTQSFFLAPQEGGGYFALSDILRIIASETPPVAISQADNQENEIKKDVGSVVGSREAESVKTDHVAGENKVAASPPPQPQKDATNSSYTSIVTSLFSRLHNLRGYVRSKVLEKQKMT